MSKKQLWERAYEDWEALVGVAGAGELLRDPRAIWDEAWRAATMEITQMVEEGELRKKIAIRMLR